MRVMPTHPKVRQAMAEIAESMSRPQDVAATLEHLTHAAVQTVPGVDIASINILQRDGVLTTLAPTDPLAVELDRLQSTLEEGPCYDAAEDRTHYVCEDLRKDPRWPRYGPQAADLGIGAQMGLDLPASERGRAALNLYARSPGPFGDAAEVAELFASSAALAMGFAQTLDTLSGALKTRTEIGKAIGIVMERYQIDSDRAFHFLARLSQDTNTRLHEIALEISNNLEQQAKSANGD
jgi:hypothetical protein